MMKKLHLPIQNIVAVLVIALCSSSLQAQEGAYTAVKTKAATHVSTDHQGNVIEPVIKVKGRTDRRILLSWAPFPGAVSHYVMERSADGRLFEEAGLFFTGDWGEEPMYNYPDTFRKPYLGPLFYRLRVVGLDGSEIYTPVTVLQAI